MENTAWNDGAQGVDREMTVLSAVYRRPAAAQSRPRYCVVLGLRGVAHAADVVRRIVGAHRGELEWLSGNQLRHATRVHLRLRAQGIYDMVTAFEAAGFDVVRVVMTR
jgi:hypothetical protein